MVLEWLKRNIIDIILIALGFSLIVLAGKGEIGWNQVGLGLVLLLALFILSRKR